MIKLITHCQVSGGSSPSPGTVVQSVKLVALQGPKNPNAEAFAGGGAGNVDLINLTIAACQQFKVGSLIEVTFRDVSPPLAGEPQQP